MGDGCMFQPLIFQGVLQKKTLGKFVGPVGFLLLQQFFAKLPPKNFKNVPWKTGGWKTSLLPFFWNGPFLGDMLVFRGVIPGLLLYWCILPHKKETPKKHSFYNIWWNYFLLWKKTSKFCSTNMFLSSHDATGPMLTAPLVSHGQSRGALW